MGAVGPDHFVVTVNRLFQVYEKESGARIVNTGLGSFLPGSSGDPRVLYDQHSDRWVVVVTDFSSRLYLAVSLTDDPTGAWFKTSFVMSAGADEGPWPDYPTLASRPWHINCPSTSRRLRQLSNSRLIKARCSSRRRHPGTIHGLSRAALGRCHPAGPYLRRAGRAVLCLGGQLQ
jgi:hypothetical protein